jgi:ligand-binding sensor domain-containing protein
MHFRPSITLLYFSVICHTLFSQPFDKLPRYKSFGEDDGFINTNYLTDITLSSAGEVYILNFSNAYRYDGENFYTIEKRDIKPSSFITFGKVGENLFAVDMEGKVFFIENDKFLPWKGNPRLDSFKDINYHSLPIFLNDSTYLFSAGGSTFRMGFSGEVSEDDVQLEGEILKKYEEDEWFYFSTTKCVAGDNCQLTVVNKANKHIDSVQIPVSPTQQVLRTVFHEDTIFLINGSRQLKVFNTKKGELSSFVYDDIILNVVPDPQGGFYIGFKTKGTYYYPSLQSKPQLIYEQAATPAIIDREGGLWLYHEEKLLYISYPRLHYIKKRDINQSILALDHSERHLYFADDKGSLFKYDPATSTIDSLSIDLNKGITDLAWEKKAGRLWISGRGFLGWLKPQENIFHEYPIDSLNFNEGGIINVDATTESDLVAFIQGNKYVLQKEGGKRLTYPRVEGRILKILPLSMEKQFIGTTEGIFLYQPDTLINVGTKDSLLTSRVFGMETSPGGILISNEENGLVWYRKGESILIRYQGQAINKSALFKKNEYEYWVVAKEGCFHLKFQDNGDYRIKAFERIPTVTASSFKFFSGSLWWGTWQKGLLEVPVKFIEEHPLDPRSNILIEMRVDHKEVSWEDQDLHFPALTNRIEFSNHLISFQDWELSFRYRLRGLTREWAYTEEEVVQFTTLPPGNYTYEIQYRKGAQMWKASREISFEIVPPFWKRWWFIGAVLLFTAGAIWVMVHFRIKRIRKKNQLILEKLQAEQTALKAQMNPHFIFNIISSVQYLVLNEENDKAAHFLNRFSTLMRNILDYSSQASISIKEELEFLEDYITLEKLRQKEPMEVIKEMSIPSSREKFRIPPFLIQPLIENAIHHGLKHQKGRKELRLIFEVDHEYLFVEIADNGIGRQKSEAYLSESRKARRSHGLKNIRSRLAMHDKTNQLLISDRESGSGTKVNLKIKLIPPHESTNN